MKLAEVGISYLTGTMNNKNFKVKYIVFGKDYVVKCKGGEDDVKKGDN